MRTTYRSLLVVCFTILLSPSLLLAQAVTITFRVTVPPATPADAKIFVVGDAKALGEWKQDGGAELKREADHGGPYVGKVTLAKDKPVEFKVTRGSWETVEKNADGSEMANRTLTPTRNANVDIEVAAWSDQVKPPAGGATGRGGAGATTAKSSTRTGDVRVHPKFHSKLLNNDRDLFVYLPPGYATDTKRRYPVFYMHDGQNLFDAATSFAGEWNADETAEKLIAEKKIQPIIIVGIANSADRIGEYTPFSDPNHPGGGKGSLYADFLVREVKPFIDATYRTSPGREDTAVGGSSLGGLVSLHIARRYPLQFSKFAIVSPALWWNNSAILATTQTKANWLAGKRFWIDMGTDEGDTAGFARGVDDVKALGDAMEKAGLSEGHDYVVRVIKGAKHNETAWSVRFGEILTFLFPA